MSIKKGESWGRLVELPRGVPVATGDAGAARILSVADGAAVVLTGGDLARTVGRGAGATPQPGDQVRAFDVDLLRARLDDGPSQPVLAHLLMRSPWIRGGPWRGPAVAAMNAEFFGRYNVAPRGHPNDGRVEIVELSADMPWRARWNAWRRLPTGSHLPHPQIDTRSVRSLTLNFERDVTVILDGERTDRARHIEVVVDRDAGLIYI
ncbi:MAG: hypothetical protein AAGF73_12325 [Actinomycetota bacterium]